MATFGMPTAADLLKVLDPLGAGLDSWHASAIGWGVPDGSDSTLWSGLYRTARSKVMGDGSSEYGIENAELKLLLSQPMDDLYLGTRQDQVLANACRRIVDSLDQQIIVSAPSGWRFYDANGRRPLDMWLSRLNGSGPSVPATPSHTPVATAATGGALPESASGDAPRIKLAYVGAYDHLESQPCTASSQVAITAGKSAYTVTLPSGNVPSGVTKVRVYRQFFNNSGAGDPFYWDQDLAVTAGVAFSTYTLTLTQPDALLRTDISPVTWCSALIIPATAQVLMYVNAALVTGVGRYSYPTMTDAAMLSEHNCVPNRTDEYHGLTGKNAHVEFGRWDLSGAYGATGPLLANLANEGAQGYLGGYGLSAYVVSVLDAPITITGYTATYFDATNPRSAQVENASGLSIALAAAAGSRAQIVAGGTKIYRTVTAMAQTGGSTGVLAVCGDALRNPL